jgi:hypothetical protein
MFDSMIFSCGKTDGFYGYLAYSAAMIPSNSTFSRSTITLALLLWEQHLLSGVHDRGCWWGSACYMKHRYGR